MLTVEVEEVVEVASRDQPRGMVEQRGVGMEGGGAGSSMSACTAAVTLLERVILR
jgi:hypothetical protein